MTWTVRCSIHPSCIAVLGCTVCVSPVASIHHNTVGLNRYSPMHCCNACTAQTANGGLLTNMPLHMCISSQGKLKSKVTPAFEYYRCLTRARVTSRNHTCIIITEERMKLPHIMNKTQADGNQLNQQFSMLMVCLKQSLCHRNTQALLEHVWHDQEIFRTWSTT